MHGRGGAQRATQRLLQGLRERGVEAALAADRPSDELRTSEFFQIECPHSGRTESQIADAVRACGPDVVHVVAGGSRTFSAVGRECRSTGARNRGCGPLPWIVSVHNVPPAQRASPWLMGRNRLHYGLRHIRTLPNVLAWRRFLASGSFAAAVCYSEHVRSAILAAGASPRRVHAIPFGVGDAEPVEACPGPSLFPARSAPRLVTVGGLVHHKGLHDALDAADRLVRRWPRLHYVLIGEPRDAAYARFVRDRIAQLGLEGHISVHASVSEAMRVRTLSEADLYLQPSHEEGFCLAYSEAAAITPRLLGTRTGAMPEMSAGDAAMTVVPARDPGALEHAAVRLLALTPTSAQLPGRNRRLEGAFCWEAYIRRHIDLYRSVSGGVPVADITRPEPKPAPTSDHRSGPRRLRYPPTAAPARPRSQAPPGSPAVRSRGS